MSDKLPNLSYYDSSGQEYSFSKPYSDNTAQLIDNEVKAMIAQQYERAKQILTEKTEGHGKLANILLEREIIYADDLEKIFGSRRWISRSQEIFDNKKEDIDDAAFASKPIGSGENLFNVADGELPAVNDQAAGLLHNEDRVSDDLNNSDRISNRNQQANDNEQSENEINK